MGQGGNKRLRSGKKQGSYSFFMYTTSPKRIPDIARIVPKPGACVLAGDGTAVTAVV
jgi:hypothetical protein